MRQLRNILICLFLIVVDYKGINSRCCVTSYYRYKMNIRKCALLGTFDKEASFIGAFLRYRKSYNVKDYEYLCEDVVCCK